MKGSEKVHKFTDKHPSIGPRLWIVSIQFFITQLIVALAWPVAYSLRNNTISDLGNTVCGIYSDRYVCSPLHNLMNAGFILLGITMVLGSVLLYHHFRQSFGSALGFGAMAASGVGTALVGIFPENTSSDLHSIGAFLPFFVGNVSLILFGLFLNLPAVFRFYTIFSGVISLIAFIFFVSGNYLGIGIGGIERLVAHPQTIWLIIFGYYASKREYLHHQNIAL